jgi:hypothetical protein
MSEKKMEYAPMRVVIRAGSEAAKQYTRKAGIDPEALAPGFAPTPSQDLINHGGKAIRDLKFANFYVAGQTSWRDGDIHNIDRALSAAMSDRNLNNVIMQYFNNQAVTSKQVGSLKLPGASPAVVTQGDAEMLLRNLDQQGKMKGMDLNSTVINLLLPSGTVLTTDEGLSTAVVTAEAGEPLDPQIPIEDEASSTSGLGGYHGSIHKTMSGVAVTIYYSIIAFSEVRPDGSNNGIVAFPEPWKNVVATCYHELNEARTDADVEDAIRTGQTSFVGWTSARGEEIGDEPIRTATSLSEVFKEVPLTDGSGVVPVQLMYSNAVHGPEGPIPQPH